MQDRRDMKGGTKDSWDAGLWRHPGQEVFRTGGIQDRFDIQVRYDAGK